MHTSLAHLAAPPTSAFRILLTVATILGVTAASRWARSEPLRIDAATEKKVYPEIEEAKQRLAKQDIEGALESFNAAAKAHSELPNGRVQLANVYFSINRPREARAQLEKGITDFPNDPETYLVMAEIALREGRWTDAGLLSERGVGLLKGFKGDADKKKDLMTRAFLGAAMTAQQHERWEDARKLLAELIKANPDSAAAHYRLGQVLFEMDKEKDAYAELQAAARMDEDIPSPEMTMAQLFEKDKDRANAEKWMKQAVAADPKRLKTRLDAVQWMLRTGDLEGAKAQVAEALKIDPESQDALFLAGRVARFSKEYPQAQKYLERAYLESPGAGSVANELALTLCEIGEDERKRAFTLAEATYRQQRDVETAATLGWICYRMGRMEDAERMFNALATANQFSPDAAYYFAVFADDRNRGEAAKGLLEAAIKGDAPFAHRAEAQKLFDRLTKKSSAVPAKTELKPAADKLELFDTSKSAPSKAPAKATPAKAPATKAPPAKGKTPTP
ncbi:MAG TPA: tetratricopeptide repeat protein [Pirellulales bacterium]|nr:tetratricopeptide repeat protein [Pirellulales bacterium]